MKRLDEFDRMVILKARQLGSRILDINELKKQKIIWQKKQKQLKQK